VNFVPIMSFQKKTGIWPEKHNSTFWMKAMIYSLGSVVFFLKLRKVGSCHFEITESKISRKSKLGTKDVSWEEVLNIHIMPFAHMFEIGRGLMPLPYRCFDGEQSNELEKLGFTKFRTYLT